jgi:hypothetical protein
MSMDMKRRTYFLLGVGAVVLVFALAGRQTRSATPNDFHFDAAKLKDKKVWTQVNTEPYYISSRVDLLCAAPSAQHYQGERKRNPHASTFVTVYVNNVGREAMFAKESPRFPQGSVIVKEKIGTDVEGRKPVLYTLMRKREPGFNPSVGDWEFSVVSGNGTTLEASGKLENCQSCHIEKKDSDFVFRPYLKSE